MKTSLKRLRRLSAVGRVRALCAFVALISSAVLVGWEFNIVALKSVLPSYISMKVNTALSMLLLAAATALTAERPRGVRLWGSYALICVTVSVSLATLAEYAFDLDFHIDEFFFLDPSSPGNRFPPGRLAPISAVCFLLVGLASVAHTNPWRRQYGLSRFFLWLVFLMAFQAMVGYLLGVTYMFGKAYYTQMALHTAVLFICLCIAVMLSQQSRGQAKAWSSFDAADATFQHRLMAAAILTPTLVQWLLIRGEKAGYFVDDFGVLVRVMATSSLLLLVMYLSLASLRARAAQILALESDKVRVDAEAVAAQLAAHAKSQFMAHMSHEVRTPLNGILGVTEMLLDESLTQGQQKLATVIHQAGQQLLGIVNDILDFSKIEAGKVELEVRAYEPRKLLAQQLSLLQGRAEGKGLALQGEVAADVPTYVMGDTGRLAQILLNLLTNAIKFTEHGTVDVAISRRAAQLHIAVRDQGIGIEPAACLRLFKPFTQADCSTSRTYGGTGLGLAICRGLVEQMGGRLDFTSELGKGSLFWFSVPLQEADPVQPAIAAQPRNRTFSPLTIGGRAPRLLVAEDNEVNQMVVTSLLRKLGCEVQLSKNGREALEAFQNGGCDIVLMDCHMPEMDGFAATAAIRACEPAGSHTPIIALTASALPEDMERCRLAGMDAHLCKPFRPEHFIAVLKKYVESTDPV